MEILRKTGLIALHKEIIHLYYQHLYRKTKLRSFFMGVASFYLLKRFSQLMGMLMPSFRRNLSNRYGQGSWAVVTGASDGIGKEFCIELAKQGFNIVLVARNLKKMDDVCLQLQAFGVQTKIIVADFNQGSTVDFYQRIYQELQNLDISILVNNVGYGSASEFAQQKIENIFQILRVNSISNLMMTKILISKLEQRNKKSAVISLSSGLAQLPCPLVSVYGATKAFNHYFPQALAITSKNTDFLSVTPLGVSTNMMGNQKGNGIVEPNQLVKNVLNDLSEGKQTTCGSTQHRRAINYLLWRKPSFTKNVRIQIGNQLKAVYDLQPKE